MSSRNLQIKELNSFRDFLLARGWVPEEPKKSEALRMRHKREKNPVILQNHEAGEHFTTYGVTDRMAQAFLHQRKLSTLTI